MKNLIKISLISLLISTSVLANDEQTNSDEWKFGGAIELGVAAVNGKSNEVSTFGDAKIEHLSDSADSETKAEPVIGLTLRAKKNDTMLYLKTIEYTGASIGVTQRVKKFAFDVNVFGNVLLDRWKNPYTTGVDREETDATTYGAKLRVQYDITKEYFIGAAYRYMKEDVSDDEIGDLIDELQRDTDRHAFDLRFGYQKYSAALRYEIGDAKGDANSYDYYGISGNARFYVTPKTFLSLNANIGQRDYDENNPLFGKTRDEFTYGGTAIYRWINPIGVDNLYAFIGAMYQNTDSNIDFFDSEIIGGFTGLGYKF